MQEVENFRRDVRVVNLSLLNTDWYIRQLRDEEPKVPIKLDDRTVDMLGLGAIRDSTGNIIYTSRFMVDHIIQQDRKPGGWLKQPYFAVTVPEHMGLDKNFTLEGLVYRVNPDTTGVQVDEAVTRHSLYDVFKYRGLFKSDGSWDTTVYKDENASTLSRNYAAAHLQLAFLYRKRGQIDRAIAEMERVSRMFPDYTDVMVPLGSFYMDAGDTTRALALFKRISDRNPQDVEARYYYGVILSYRGNVAEALKQLDEVIRLDPTYTMGYYAAYFVLWEHGDRARALNYVERWVQANPNDGQAQQLLEQQRRAMGLAQPAPVRPPITPLP
jgi:Tfp pilus assembly protein PilF